jgi:K+-sensing histidine kinase KdpD
VHVALKKKDLDRPKLSFSLVSHEFKTPLAVISTSTTLAGEIQMLMWEESGRNIWLHKNKVKYLNNMLMIFYLCERLDTGKTNYNITSFFL